MQAVVITGTGLYTPEHAISNEELVEAYNAFIDDYGLKNAEKITSGEMPSLQKSSADFIESRSGIKSRFVMDKSGILDSARLCPSLPERVNNDKSLQCEISVNAAEEALSNANLNAQQIDLVIVACSNLQRPYPAIAVEVQSWLGCEGYAFDMNVACSSATFGIQAATNAIQSGSAKRVLVINPEICSAHLNFQDRDSHFIFGDAATAIVLESGTCAQAREQYQVVGTRLKTVYSNNIRNNFGFLNRADEQSAENSDKLFKQNGRKVFKEVVPLVVEQIENLVSELNLDIADIKQFWLHQANLNMNQLICKKLLGRESCKEEAPIVLDRYANTSSAGSIIAFHLHRDRLLEGEYGIISSFGAGYSLGSVVVKKVTS